MLPNFPTDNLYKFMALSGTVIILFSVYYPIHVGFEALEKEVTLEEEGKVLDARIDQLYRDLESQFPGALARDSEKRKFFDPTFEREAARDRNDAPTSEGFDEMTVDVLDQLDQLREADIRLEGKIILVRELRRHTNRVEWLSWLTLFIGAGLAGLGYTLWYTRVQRPLDNDLQKVSDR
ncbi:hypothetical protein SADO_11969 [Salinisphaera dokdonensis CL-ES53]|uniref:Uncharacterized protein n=1 Tax=Salinisphaera dokdonensis CL-ES53 TaxID=1304272 RepID=A0ABV2B2W3_9GAMM